MTRTSGIRGERLLAAGFASIDVGHGGGIDHDTGAHCRQCVSNSGIIRKIERLPDDAVRLRGWDGWYSTMREGIDARISCGQRVLYELRAKHTARPNDCQRFGH